MSSSSDALGSTLQVVVVGLVSVLVVVIVAIFEFSTLNRAVEYIGSVASRGANVIETLAVGAVGQTKSILDGSYQSLSEIVRDVSNSVVTGLQLIFGAIITIGKAVLTGITEGAAALTEILIELTQNVVLAMNAAFTPLVDIFAALGNVLLDIITSVQAAFGPIVAVITATVLLTCCISKAVRDFPGVPYFALPGNCATDDCGCLCSCSACDPNPNPCTCPSRGSNPCCTSFL